MIQTKRIEWVDVVKYICIIMVMLSHLETCTGLWNAFYFPFYLSAFFFVSGYVYKAKDNFLVFLYKKFRQLFIPWLVFSVFDILLSQIISFNKHENLLTELKWNFLQIRGQGDGIWFVAALFIAFIPFYFFIEWYDGQSQESSGKNGPYAVAIAIAWLLSLISVMYTRLVPADAFPWNSTALPWHIEYMFQAMFYMVLGYVFRHQFEEWFDRHNTLKLRIVVCNIYMLVVLIPYFMEIKMSAIIGAMYSYATSVLGIAAVVLIAKVVRSNKYVNYVGQNTLIYFSLHGKVYSIIQMALKRYAGGFYTAVLRNEGASSVFCLALSILLSVVLIIPAYIINRWFSFIMGRKKQK